MALYNLNQAYIGLEEEEEEGKEGNLLLKIEKRTKTKEEGY